MLKGKTFCYYLILPQFIGRNNFSEWPSSKPTWPLWGSRETASMLCRIALWDCLWKQSLRAPRVRESGFGNLENFCPWNKESKKNRHAYGMGNPRLWNPENSSRNPGILLAIESGNPSSTDKESGVQCLESRIQHWLGLPSMGRITSFIGYCKIMRGTRSKSGPQTVP